MAQQSVLTPVGEFIALSIHPQPYTKEQTTKIKKGGREVLEQLAPSPSGTLS